MESNSNKNQVICDIVYSLQYYKLRKLVEDIMFNTNVSYTPTRRIVLYCCDEGGMIRFDEAMKNSCNDFISNLKNNGK